MSIINTSCHCGHDEASHYECEGTCLGVHCECLKYIHRDDPDRRDRTQKPFVWPRLDTPVPPTPVPTTHPMWCTCPDCFKP